MSPIMSCFLEKIQQSIDEILRITSTTKDELESYSEKNMPLWITSLCIREISD